MFRGEFVAFVRRVARLGQSCLAVFDYAEMEKTRCSVIVVPIYGGWKFNTGNYLFTTDTK